MQAMKTATPAKQKTKKTRTRRKVHTDEYRAGNQTWKLRYIVPGEGDRHKSPFWIGDNCDKRDRKRITAASKGELQTKIDGYAAERAKYGTDYAIDPDLRESALRAKRVSGGRATLDEIVKYWEARHPMDGRKITLAKMADDFIADREAKKNRPATIRAIRQKLTAFKEAIGEDTAIAGIWEDDIKRFMAGRGGGDESRRAWKKVLGSFFNWCLEEKKAIQVNPITKQSIKVEKQKPKDPPTWAARDVESFMRIAEAQAPDMVAGFALLWWAGLRPTELSGQYGIQDARIKDAKDKLKQARTNYNAEKMRLGLVREQGKDTLMQAANRLKLAESKKAKALKDARDNLTKAIRNNGGTMPHLQWADICLDDDEKFITVRAEYSKTGKKRHVDILPNLEIWLRKYRKIGGPVVDNPTAFRRARKRILKQMIGVKWAADICRHSFASYHYKANGNRDKLAEMMGHTAASKEIERHYKDSTVSRADAVKFWKIVPDGETMPEAKKHAARKGA